ncbi:MAG: FixH family protein [Propionivibrio sp.]
MNRDRTGSTLPWYRYRWPWLLMLGPFVVVVAGVITTYLAVVSDDGLVDDDYYKQGLAINQVTERNEQAVKLGLSADVMQSADRSRIRVMLRGNPAVRLPPAIKLRITHPTRSGVDQNLVLPTSGFGEYSGQLHAPLAGRWHVAIEDDQDEWRLAGDWIVEQNESLRLPIVADAGAVAGRK